MTLMATAVLVSRKTRSPSPEELDRSGIPFFGSKTGNPCISFSFFSSHFYVPASGQAVVTGVVPSSPPVLALNFYRA